LVREVKSKNISHFRYSYQGYVWVYMAVQGKAELQVETVFLK